MSLVIKTLRPFQLAGQQEPLRFREEHVGGFVGTWHQHPSKKDT